MGANLANVVTVSLLPSQRSLSRTNMNICAVFTSQLGILNSFNRTVAYLDLNSVKDDFGSDSAMYQHASVFFAQTKNPANSGGYFVASYWRAVSETVTAQAGKLKGGQVSEAVLIGQLQGVSDGSLVIEVDGTPQTLSGLDFRTVDEISDIVTLIDTPLTGATLTYSDQRFIITSLTTGASSEINFVTAHTSGTFIGQMLKLATGTGAVEIMGAIAGTLTAETKIDAVTEALKYEPFRGFVFIDNPTDVESKDLATYAKANDIITYDVFTSADNLEKDTDNVVWDIKLSGLENCRMIYRKDGDRKIATAYMARMHTINFNAENSAITMNLKELSGIGPEDYSQNEINKAKRVGLELYTTFGDLPKLLTSGANGWTDNVYNLIAVKLFVQIDLFNLLGTTGTKLAQITRDVQKIVNTVERTLTMFRKANVIGAGTWNSSDDFGDPLVFRRNILTNGFYVLAQPLSEQIQSDRTERKSPVIQSAIKLSGAVHSIDCIIRVEE